jgi:hypothetical protein
MGDRHRQTRLTGCSSSGWWMRLPTRPTTSTASTACWTDKDAARCEREEPGLFPGGIPGILAHREDGRLAETAKVNR